jgi:signal transduction histidine kinase
MIRIIAAITVALAFASCSTNNSSLVNQPAEVLADTSNVLTIFDVQEATFERTNEVVANLGVVEHAFWIRYRIASAMEPRVLEIQSPNIDSVDFYLFSGSNLLASYFTGEGRPFSDRPIASPNFAFPIPPGDQELIAYVRLRSGKQILLPLALKSTQSHYNQQNQKDIFFGIYAGIIIAMLLYNIFIWFSVKERNYLYYVFFILFVGLTQLTLNGYGNQFFWPNWSWAALRSVHFSGILSGITTVLFAQNYLRIRQYSPKINLILYFYIAVYAVAAITAIAGQFVLSYNLINFCAVASLLLVIAAYRSYRKGYRQALFFLIAWSIFLISVTVYVLRDFGVLPYNLVTQYALPVGSALEVLLLSFALADNINQLKREKELEQEAKLQALGEKERFITEQNVVLEAKVADRTRELANSNSELNQALTTLQSAQAQLIDAEKMASLGQLTAGIAHELNNPINFVSSNINPLSRDLEEIFEVLDSYSALEPNDPALETHIAAVRQLAEQYDLDFLRSEISQLMKGIGDGAARTAEIVKGLRIFSRLDEDTLKRADINECVRSTLIILKSSIKSESKVYDQLDPELPEINCYPGKLNQVFMNILVNALQATAASNKSYDERRVEVKTTFDDQKIYISIRDNGAGMPPEVKSRIFEPFFTTKEVGQGTGLGLSIVLGIINDHNGRIEVNSIPGEGTEFILTLSRTL